MKNPDTTIPIAQPPISSSTDAQPQETLLQRGMFDPPVTPGTLGHLDRFEIIRLLGEGGMGQVYLAREPRTDTRVAVKILRPQMADDPQSVHRFLTEARHMYRLSHPRILRVLEVSDRPAGPYYVMPYVEGGSLLGQYRPDKPMPTERILAIASQVAEALAHAHAHGLIHRDLKPGNVLLEKDGNAYLTDFGLVRTVFNDSMVDASSSHLEGTAPYMSPAVARGEAEDTRCDIYAFGALLYELLAGQPPYTGRTPQIILDQVLKGPPTPLREVNPKASPALVKIAEGCLARELRDRYASMADVVCDLDRVAKGQAPFGPHRQQARLPRLAALLAGTLAVAALAMVAVHHFSAASSVTAQTTGVPSPASGVLAQTDASAANASLSGDEPVIAEDDADKELLPDTRALSPTTMLQGPFACMVTNGVITVAKYTGPGGVVIIPGTLNGLPVTSIGNYAFHRCANLVSVTIPASVTSIGGTSFEACSGLTSIIVDAANPVYCSSADGIVFSKDKTTLICYPAGKSGNYVIPNSVTNIGWGAFLRCGGLTSVTIPRSVTGIGGWAFFCTGLTSVTLPDSVTSIEDSVFRNCYMLETVTIPNSVTNIGVCAFRSSRLTHLTLPDSVASVGSYAFGVSGLTTLTIPANVTTVNDWTFCRLPSLTALYFKGNAPSKVGGRAFESSPNVTVYYLPGTKGWGRTFGGRPTAVWDGNYGLPVAKTLPGTLTAYDLAAPENLRYQKLSVTRVSSGEMLNNKTYRYKPDGKAHSMLLELQPADLSKAVDVRFEINKDEAYGPIKITLRDYGELISDSIDITKYMQENRDGYQAVRIPATAFKTRGWDMQSVKLLFIGDQTLRDTGGPGFSIRAIEAGLAKASQNKIVEGEGWQGFRVGATREELVKALGDPDPDSKGQWLKWKKLSVHCILDDKRGAFELRFDDGFKGETAAGIEIGSALKETLAAYGEPATAEDKGRTKKLSWSSKGILIWFNEDKVSQIVVFSKK